MSSPQISYDERTHEWVLDRKFIHRGIVIPSGFRFDLASVPRCLWPVVAPFELSVTGALIHDYLYRKGGFVEVGTRHFVYSRRGADKLFRRLMKLDGVPLLKRWGAYLAVRGFGWMAWRRHRGI